MTWLSRLLAGLGLRREAPSTAPPAPPPALPVLAVGDAVAAEPWPQRADLARILPALDAPSPDIWAAALAEPCRRYAISTPMRLSAFLATTMHESGNFRRLVESLDYRPEGLRATWPSRFTPELAQQLGRVPGRPANQRAIAERAYGGRMGNGPEGSGDGWAYRGRGLLQITGRDNYRAAAAALGRPLDGLAAWLETPAGAAESAAWWWAAHGCNELADAGRVEDWRRRVNGGLIGLEDVRARYGRAREVVRG